MTIRQIRRRPTKVAAGIAGLALLGLVQVQPAHAVAQRSQEFFSNAVERLNRGEVNAAIIQLRNALQEDPENTAARLMLGRLYLQTGDVAGAEKELRRAHDAMPSDETELLLGQALLALNRPADVVSVVGQESSDPDVRRNKILLRSEALLNLGRLDEAEASLNAVLRAEAMHPTANLLAARLAASRGDLQAASEIVELVVNVAPDSVPAWLMKAQFAFARGSLGDALAAVDRVEAMAPGQPPAAILRAEILTRRGELEEAETVIRRLLEQRPNDAQATYVLANVLTARGEPAEADRLLRQVSEPMRNFPPALLLTGLVKAQLQQYAQATDLLSRYLGLVPSNRVARRVLANVQVESGSAPAAIRTLEPLTGPTSQDLPSLQLLASAQLRAGQLDAAEATLRRIAGIGAQPFAQQALSFVRILEQPRSDEATNQRVRETLIALDELRNGRLDVALSRGEELLARFPKDPEVLNLVGGIRLIRNENEEARRLFQAALEQNPDFGGALANLDRLDFREGNQQAIENRLRDRLASNPDEDAALRLTEVLVRQDRKPEAEAHLLEATRALPRAVNVRAALLALYQERGETEKAQDLARALLDLGRDGVPGALQAAGNYYLAVQQPEAAIEAFRAWVEQAPSEMNAHFLLARAYYVAGDLAGATETLVAARENGPANLSINTSLLDVYVEAGEAEAALDLADRVAEIDAGQGAILTARALARTDRLSEAVERLDAAFSAQPSATLARELFVTRWRLGNQEEAIQALRVWVASNPDDAGNVSLLSDAYLLRGEKERAVAMLEQAVQLVPNDARVLNNLGAIRYELQRAGALEAARRAYTLAPGSPEILDTLGWILVREGEVEEGLALLREAEQGLSDNPTVRFHLAYALKAAGDAQEAKAILEALVAGSDSFAERAEAEALLAELGRS
jgi:cellulose synthase operon protein C